MKPLFEIIIFVKVKGSNIAILDPKLEITAKVTAVNINGI
jgi:hypothetical protein